LFKIPLTRRKTASFFSLWVSPCCGRSEGGIQRPVIGGGVIALPAWDRSCRSCCCCCWECGAAPPAAAADPEFREMFEELEVEPEFWADALPLRRVGVRLAGALP